MYTPAPDEKVSLVMAYTQNKLARAEVITKESVRVSTWLRTQGVPEYLHLVNVQVLLFGSGSVKNLAYPEMYLPVSQLLAFHLVPPTTDPLDYVEDEPNRVMEPISALIGTFVFKGKLRISSKAGIERTIESSLSAWLSVYDVEITNPYLPQLQMPRVPLILINPKQASLGLEAG
jgi:hypothetical protein